MHKPHESPHTPVGFTERRALACLRTGLAVTLFAVIASTDAFHLNAVSAAAARGAQLAALTYLVIGGALAWIRQPRFAALGRWVGVVCDISAVTFAIYLTGGPLSPFLFLYLPVASLAAIFRARGSALVIAAGCGSTYALLAGLTAAGAIRFIDGTVLTGEPPGGIPLQILGLVSALVLIVVGTAFLARRLSQTVFIAAESAALAGEQRELLGQIPDGILKLRADGAIEYLNEAAARILGAPGSALLGASLDARLHELGAPANERFLPVPSLATADITLPSEGKEATHLNCVSRPIFNPRRELTGAFVVLRDETTLRSAQEQLEIQERMARLLAHEKSSGEPVLHSGFIGESAVMRRVFTLIDRVAAFDATVLISGESGTGKELAARAIHRGSAHSSGPFVAVNCGAIPENLLESELFGHRRGAFTGADADALGLFRRADGGTIFLDEIGELPLAMQAKLLRVLQEKKVRPVGGDTDIPIRVRVLAATNRNLRAEVRAGRFREDLFYRLNVVSIALPPLRDRREDIPTLADSLLRRLTHGRGPLPVVPPATMRLLMHYDYPGNVRELENILERALVFGGEVLLPEHLPEQMRDDDAGEPPSSAPTETQIVFADDLDFPLNLDLILAQTERRYLELALAKTNGAKKKAADLLGLNFRSFRYRLQKFNIAGEDGGEA